jgi:hypothetical protein
MSRHKSGREAKPAKEAPFPFAARQKLVDRRNISVLAAKLIAEQGMTDYQAAKRKAACTLGYASIDTLPDDGEIDSAVREYQAIFQAHSQPKELLELRKLALAHMRELNQFFPRLHGPILAGTANRLSCIELDLVVEAEKALDFFLLSKNVSYRTPSPKYDEFITEGRIFTWIYCDVPVSVVAYPTPKARAQQCKRSRPGRNFAGPELLEALLASMST